jgi:predicted RNase H-like nuclease
MRFLGIDFGWHGKPSGLAALEWNNRSLHLLTIDRLAEFDDILAWIDTTGRGGPAVVAVDGPTIITNASGMRAADRLMHVHFGRFHAGCYPANLSRPYAARTVALGDALEQRGFEHSVAVPARKAGCYQLEVHPHSAMVQLFDLPRILKYKKGRLADRRLELERYRGLMLSRLPRLCPPVTEFGLPELPHTGAAMKDIEDRLDAVICAYIAAHWWYWGTARNQVCGTRNEGYIVVPHRHSSRSTTRP